jgi:cytochrome P450
MTTMPDIDSIDLTTVDLTDPAWFADGPPHALFARMRRERPVHWNVRPTGEGFWSLTRAADVAAVSRDPENFSSFANGVFVNVDQVMALEILRGQLLYKDPPEHTAYRLILQKAFTPNTVRHLADNVRARVTRTVDGFIEEGRCDLVGDLAVPVPLGVLTDLMGLPEAHVPRLYEWTERLEAAQRSPEPLQGGEVNAEMGAYLFEQILEQTGRGETDSLVMRLRNAEVEGQRLGDGEILSFFGLLVFAGNDTTRNTTATGLLALLQHADQLQLLRDNPELIPNAVEELLRYTTVVNYFVRTAKHDIDLSGTPVAAGDRLILWYSSASRDDAIITDPQRLDVTRGAPDHQAFGGGGRHFCLGAGLARLELRIILEEVTRRMADLTLAGPVPRVPSSWANGLTSLPVSFTPGPREG